MIPLDTDDTDWFSLSHEVFTPWQPPGPYAGAMVQAGGSGVRLADVLVALSLATDLGLGQPSEHMLRSSRLALRLGERIGLSDRELQTLFDVSLLTYVGCPIYGNEAAALFGDDIDFRARVHDVDLAGFPALAFMLRRAGSGGSVLHRAHRAATIMAGGGKGVIEQMANHCAAAGVLAHRLGLGDDVRTGIEQTYARWDGRGAPATISGEGLSLATRIAHVAEASEIFHCNGGVAAAVEMVKARRGTHFDPAVVAAVESNPEPLFHQLADATVDAVLDAEPLPRPLLSDDELDAVLEAVGDFSDLRCPYFAGHARGTAELAAAAAEQMRLPAESVTLVRRAGLVHDMGRVGVPGSIWDKPAPLNNTERERMRLHAYLVERMFSRSGPLQRIGVLAGTHHERMDGSGYHRSLAGALISAPGRILAVADAYHAMRQLRPHRDRLDPKEASKQLRSEADAGRLDPIAVDAVLAASGQATSGKRGGGPAGLTAREAQVLGLLAQGLPNKGVARKLSISPKTVSNHIEHLYSKLGVSTRAAATLYAMRHGLVDANISRSQETPDLEVL